MKKRVISLFMMVIMILSSFQITAIAETLYWPAQTLEIINSAIRQPIMKSGGYVDYDNFAPNQVVWFNPETNVEYAAYCVNPARRGYGDIAEYTVDLIKFDADCIVDAGGSGGAGKRADDPSTAGNAVSVALYGAVANGYPSVSAETLLGGSAAYYGVSQDHLDYAAYLATKMAIWSLIHDNYSINLWNTNAGATYYPEDLRKATV